MPGPDVGGEGPGAVPSGAQHHADRRQFVLGLDHAVIARAVLRGAEPGAEAPKSVHQRRRGRDRIPGPERGPGINAAQGGGRVAVDDDVGARSLHATRHEGQGAIEVLPRVVVTQADGDLIGLQQRLLASEGLPQQFPDDVQVQLQQRRQHAHVGDVLHQDAGPGVVEVLVAHARQRNAQDVHVLAAQHLAARPGGVV